MARMKGFDEMLARRMGATDRATIFPENFREQEGPAHTAPLVRTIYPPWQRKLPSSVDFNQNEFNAALAGVIGATVVPVEFTLPPTYLGYLTVFGIYILSPTVAQDVTFTLRINSGPVQGFDNVQFPPGVANFVVQNFSDEPICWIPDGAKVDVLVTNGSADAWTVGAKIAGYFHARTEEQRIFGSL
jgi:hypothetical protein